MAWVWCNIIDWFGLVCSVELVYVFEIVFEGI